MKCENCGAKIANDEKNCPECGVPVKSENVPNTILNADPTTSETFIFSEHLLLPSLLRFAAGIILIIIVILSFRDIKFSFMLKDAILSALFFGSLALYLFFSGIAAIIQEKNCFVCITPERVYGKIPKGFFGVKEFDIPLADIILVDKSSRLSLFRFFLFIYDEELKISTKEGETEISAFSRRLISKISKTLTDYIKKYK